MTGLAGVAAAALLSATALAHAATIKIGVSVPTLQNPFWVNAVKFAEHVAKALDADLTVVGADNREDKQLSRCCRPACGRSS